MKNIKEWLSKNIKDITAVYMNLILKYIDRYYTTDIKNLDWFGALEWKILPKLLIQD
jgi:hypothetical protein